MLCYFAEIDSLQKFFGRLNIVDRDKPISRCQEGILECLNHVSQLNGFAILAHVDGPSGYERETPGNSPHKIDVMCHQALLGIELKALPSDVYYSTADTDPQRINIGNERIKRLNLGSNQYLARVVNSDAHTLAALGRNTSGLKKVTRIKMDKPSFGALKIALQDGDARVRMEEQIPNEVPKVVGILLEGGFLDGQYIHFSPNLNCIVGGRGTGKSTTFEVVRCLSGNASNNGVVDSEIWPNNISFLWEDQALQLHVLKRASNATVINEKNPKDGPVAFHMECYAQGETERISKEGQSNPMMKLA